MKVVDIKELAGTEKQVICPKGGFTSYRALLKDDGMGFGVCKTVIPKNDPQHWHYKNHLEACYCIEGEGTLKNLETGEEFHIKPDRMYVLDKNDDHTFQALTNRVVLISIFNPPLSGKEVHKEDGSYASEVE